MHSINDLEDMLGQSYEQIRTRVNDLSNRFDGVSETGKRNKTLVTDKGLSLLRRLRELEGQGYSVESSLKEIEKDLSSNGHEEEGTETKVGETIPKSSMEEMITLKVQNEQLKDRLQDFRDQLNTKDNQIERKDDQLQQLLPAVTEKTSPEEEGVSLWKALKMWWSSPF